MSLLRSLIFVLALMVGQTHACASMLVCGDDGGCKVCVPGVVGASSEHEHCATLRGGCSNCCSVTSCSDSTADDGSSPTTPVVLTLPITIAGPSPVTDAFVPAYAPRMLPARAPPLAHGLRAPPSKTA